MKSFYFLLALVTLLLQACISGIRDVPRDKSVKVVKASFPGSLWGKAQAEAKIISQDGGGSFIVPGGSVWSFGDTFLGTRDETGTPHYFPGEAVSCSIAFLAEKDFKYPMNLQYLRGTSGKAVSPFAYFDNENPELTRIWPGNGIYINGKYYLFYTVIKITGNTEWSFEGVGQGLGVSDNPLGQYTRVIHDKSYKFPVAPTEVIKTGNYLYFFEVNNIRQGYQGVYLSRVPVTDIENPAKYEFYNNISGTFSKEIRNYTPILEDVYGQVSVAWNSYLGKYIMATSSTFFHPRRILFYTSEGITGPWKRAFEIQVPDTFKGKQVELIYCSYMHPELFRENGRVIFLTFSTRLKGAGFDCNGECVEIELEKTNQSFTTENPD